VGFLCGCCRWCMLLLAGWCGGLCGVRVSEALACCSRAFSACWVGEVSTQFWFWWGISRLFDYVSLGFIAREYGLAGPSAKLLWTSSSYIIGRPSWCVIVGFRLERGCWVGVTIIASGLLNFRHCCALRLEGKSQVQNQSLELSNLSNMTIAISRMIAARTEPAQNQP